MLSRRTGRVTPKTDDEIHRHPNRAYYSDTESETCAHVGDVGESLAGQRYSIDDLTISSSSGSGSNVSECDVTESEIGGNYLKVDTLGGLPVAGAASSGKRKPSVDIRRKHRLPSTVNYAVDQNTASYGLSEYQQRRDRLFARTMVQLRKRQLLPSYERRSVNRKTGRGFRAWKQSQREKFARWKVRYKSVVSRLELWQESIKCIEGAYGSGVVAYFLFFRWLFILNLIVCLLLVIFVIVPQFVFVQSAHVNTTDGATDESFNQSLYCSKLYKVNWTYEDKALLILDFLQGTGWMEQTVLFYGYYADNNLYIGTWESRLYYYHLPIAYITVTSVALALSLVMMARRTASGFRVIILESEHKHSRYANMALAGWDYTLNDEKMVKRKHNSLHQEIMVVLMEDDEYRRRSTRSGRERCMLISARLFINCFVLMTLAASGYSIYEAAQQSLKFRERYDYEELNTVQQLLMEYLPSLTVTILNAIIPPLFNLLVKGEDFCPEIEIQITLARTVFLRLASLAVLLGTLYSQVTCPVKDPQCNVGVTPQCPEFRCWETYVGQQVYKLVILDFFVVIAKVFLVDFPRRAIVNKYNCKLTRIIGKAQFRIPKEVLDLVYSQILCWLGLFFSPLTPAICAVKLVIVFHLKKLTCIYNHVPPTKPFRASKSQLFFMTVLLIAFILCCVPIGYIIFKIPPSRGCGPFRLHDVIFHVITTTISHWPLVVGQISEFMTSPVFILPLCILLILLVYYYSTVANARKQMLNLLTEQLIMEGQDKKFLLKKLNEVHGL